MIVSKLVMGQMSEGGGGVVKAQKEMNGAMNKK